jgi:putative SOS response-associated peptidase YedK
MCYTAEGLTKSALKYAKHRGDIHAVEELTRQLNEQLMSRTPLFCVSGFAHPELLVFTNEQPYKPQFFTWGLIPGWTKSLTDAKKFWNNTLNARGETIWEKPAFKYSAKNKRCLIYLDAFYEFHHANRKTYPFRISMKDDSPMVVAGLWESWVDKTTGELLNTTTIVTTSANPLMSKIHNNPKAELGPRMPVILTKDKQDEWLIDCKTEADKSYLAGLIHPSNQEELVAYTVGKINGKDAIGNVPEAETEVIYPELVI